LLQSGPTVSHDFSCFASTKRPFVISHTGHLLMFKVTGWAMAPDWLPTLEFGP
jgi:hypothetical protein